MGINCCWEILIENFLYLGIQEKNLNKLDHVDRYNMDKESYGMLPCRILESDTVIQV